MHEALLNVVVRSRHPMFRLRCHRTTGALTEVRRELGRGRPQPPDSWRGSGVLARFPAATRAGYAASRGTMFGRRLRYPYCRIGGDGAAGHPAEVAALVSRHARRPWVAAERIRRAVAGDARADRGGHPGCRCSDVGRAGEALVCRGPRPGTWCTTRWPAGCSRSTASGMDGLWLGQPASATGQVAPRRPRFDRLRVVAGCDGPRSGGRLRCPGDGSGSPVLGPSSRPARPATSRRHDRSQHARSYERTCRAAAPSRPHSRVGADVQRLHRYTVARTTDSSCALFRPRRRRSGRASAPARGACAAG
jgi:hypothetical protein